MVNSLAWSFLIDHQSVMVEQRDELDDKHLQSGYSRLVSESQRVKPEFTHSFTLLSISRLIIF